LKNGNITLGKNVSFYGLINKVRMGSDNSIYDNSILHFGPEAEFQTGNNVIFSYNTIIVCHKRIVIGNYVQIGEFTSIRDTTHVYNVDYPMMKASDYSEEIHIGNNVWIGRGCLICEGSIIEDGVVVAANSVVKGRLMSDCIYGGSPAKVIKKRI